MNAQLSVHDLLDNVSQLGAGEFDTFVKEVDSLREKRAAPSKTGMDEAHFWAIIGLFDWEKEDDREIAQPAIEALASLQKVDICAFQDILNEKLFALDGRRFAEQLGSNAFRRGGLKHFSVDDFLYSRCGVVANGRQFYEAVLAEPERMPKEFTFEALLYLPDRAWKFKTGQETLDHFPEKSAETFSNRSGWPGMKPLVERLRTSR